MVFDSSYFWLLLSIVGAINTFVLSLYLFTFRGSNLVNKLLATFLLMIFIRISKSISFFFYPESTKTFLQLVLTANFLSGPLHFSYIKQALKSRTSKNINWKVHILPPAGLALIVGVTWPYSNYPTLWNMHISTAIIYSWFAYLLASIVSVTPILINKTLDLSKDQNILNSMVVLCTSIALFLAYIFTSKTSNSISLLCFVATVYFSIIIFRPKFQSSKPEKYASKKISQVTAKPILIKLEKLMSEGELYKCPNLSLSLVAEKLKISAPQLSQILNDNLGTSFTSYINHHRIELAKTLLHENQKMNLKQISELCGYNNQSTFYIAFKKFANTTPAKYRKRTQHSKAKS
ncbi:helix-turn-helix domain-containing protein [Pseudoalteromonas luteoviolacea]|uniref:HTH araC/xylS-type domain-containing protein n=1 Tax=Pseudoalteromonas luteoviolacea S4054 TaxID=1129367 RepID=A0A0F6AEF9_9GAMM|nr:helix-turn-helix domain-containing protein [Pseudoalteromonas luteoviolacea]AOT11202.1 hypothetical protein S4054249_25590 [Pseudoalteromonas luteoviolacea]AOT15634.1 hypothetical protein S40542_22920 [Pseudoalteromonas luteoviolacea]AOT21023.1 hypothetical protein S4054_25510 [Pseudoalteromonas luteoviolacea]KKE84553.1 hypothetical protein N479_08285 [Pseudoalteromonas luteoviolacea S4054]KZN71302.1 hypothetical protein N481_19135 [Pseudoalteromonas luteoviolacea S4047-1]